MRKSTGVGNIETNQNAPIFHKKHYKVPVPNNSIVWHPSSIVYWVTKVPMLASYP